MPVAEQPMICGPLRDGRAKALRHLAARKLGVGDPLGARDHALRALLGHVDGRATGHCLKLRSAALGRRAACKGSPAAAVCRDLAGMAGAEAPAM